MAKQLYDSNIALQTWCLARNAGWITAWLALHNEFPRRKNSVVGLSQSDDSLAGALPRLDDQFKSIT